MEIKSADNASNCPPVTKIANKNVSQIPVLLVSFTVVGACEGDFGNYLCYVLSVGVYCLENCVGRMGGWVR